MQITTCNGYPDDTLEMFRPKKSFKNWKLVISGYWSEDLYHSGYISYYIGNPIPGMWIVDGITRSMALDGITEEDVQEGRLNDDQIQAMWGSTLKEAQNQIYQRIVAICKDAPPNATDKKMGHILYDAIRIDDGLCVDEIYRKGLY